MKRYNYEFGKTDNGVLSNVSGYATETNNFGESAFGVLNKSTLDEDNFTTQSVVTSNKATIFSVGNGDSIENRKNIIELKANGDTYIVNVGGYDGTNCDNSKNLEEEFTGIHEDIRELNEDVDRIDNTIASIHIDNVDGNELVYELLIDGHNRGTINIPKDQFLKDVDYDGGSKELIFTFSVRVEGDPLQTEDKIVRVDIANLVDTYSAGDGLNLVDHKFSVKIDPASDSHLSVTSDGIKLDSFSDEYATKEEVGSNIYTDSNYLSKETNLTEAVLQLDEEIKATNDNLDLEHANAEATYAKKTDLATTTEDGLMAATDKAKLDGINTSNFVTLAGAQTITGYKKFANIVEFWNDVILTGPFGPIGDSSIITAGQNVKDVARRVLNAPIANNDSFDIYVGGPVGDGFVMLATGVDGDEPIYIAQTDTLPGAESGSVITNLITLMDAEGNSKFNIIDADSLRLNLKWDGNNGTQAEDNYVDLQWNDTSGNIIGTIGYYNKQSAIDDSRIIISANSRNIIDGGKNVYDTLEGDYALEVGIGSLKYNAHNVLLDNSLKTINGQSLIGTGNITIEGGSDVDLSGYQTIAGLPDTITALRTDGSITYSASNVSIPTTKYTNNNGTWESVNSAIEMRIATQSTAGAMSATDKTKLDSLESPTVNAAEGDLTLWTGTQNEYDAIQTKSNTTIYFITEG